MFTGIVEELGVVLFLGPPKLKIGAEKVLSDLKVGDSIAVNGACLTVVGQDGESFWVQLSPETLRRTNLGRLRPGERVNLERAVPVGGRLGGHIVQGHVEAVSEILAVEPEGEALKMRFSVPQGLGPYIVPKGFVAVDGVSLTVVDVNAQSFSAAVIPFTRAQTTLGLKGPGDLVNIETDILGRYVERLLREFGRLGSKTEG